MSDFIVISYRKTDIVLSSTLVFYKYKMSLILYIIYLLFISTNCFDVYETSVFRNLYI